MALAILSVIAFLALFVWRFVFNSQQRRPVVREIGVPRQQDKSFLEQGLHILERGGVVIVGGTALIMLRMVSAPPARKIVRKPICSASLPSPAPRKWVTVMT